MAKALCSIFFILCASLLVDSLNPQNIAVRDPVSNDLTVPERKLRAAKRSDKLGRRDVKGGLSYDHQLHYLDDTDASDSQFGAKLAMGFKTPTLLLEDIEHHIGAIDCFDSRVYLYFSSSTAFNHAHETFSSVGKFLLITSHEGCNEDGERDPHFVSETAIHIKDHLIILSTSRVPWKHTFNSLTLDFGESEEGLTQRRHGELRPRQAAATTAAAEASSTAAPTYPAAPTSTPTETNVTASFNPSLIDKAILPPDPSLSVHGPDIPAGFNVKCKNCTVQGNINLISGSLTMGQFNSSSNGMDGFINATESAYEFVDHGYVRFQSNDFGAHIELESSITASTNLETFTAPLPTIPLTPFQIPGIASVGPQLVPQLSIGVKLSAELDFSYGFEVSIPNDSYLVLNINETSQSNYSGFDHTTVTALPFQAQLPDVSLTLVGGFIPQLLLGISFFGGDAIAGAGVFLNAPTITTTLSTVSHVNSNCENVTNNAIANDVINDIFDTLTHIDASVDLQLGVTADAQVGLGKYILKEDAPYALLDKSFSLPTGCISFDGAAKTYGPVPTSTASKAAGATGGKSTSGACTVAVPLGGRSGFGRVGVAAGFIGVVFAVFSLF